LNIKDVNKMFDIVNKNIEEREKIIEMIGDLEEEEIRNLIFEQLIELLIG
jgi:hypothetical protein